MLRIRQLLFIFALVAAFAGIASATSIVFNPTFVVTESRTILGVRYDVGYTGTTVSTRQAVLATTSTSGVTTYSNLVVAPQGTTSATYSFATGIDANRNVTMEAGYGDGVPVAVRVNLNNATTSVTDMFSMGIVNGVMYGGNASPLYVADGSSTATQLLTAGGDGSGLVFDGRLRSDNSVLLSGNGSIGSSGGLLAWRDGSLYRSYDLAGQYGYSLLDPTGYFGFSSVGTNGLARWDIEMNSLQALSITGLPMGMLTGTSDTYFYLNDTDAFRLWTMNSTLGINGRTGDVCAANPNLGCGTFASILLGMGKMNADPNYTALVTAAFRGSSYGVDLINPGSDISQNAVPEPASYLIVALGLTLAGFYSKKSRSRRSSVI